MAVSFVIFSHLSRRPGRAPRRRAAAPLTVAAVLIAAAGCSSGGDPATPPPGSGPGTPGAAQVTPGPGAPAAGPDRLTLVATGDILAYPSTIEQARADAGGTGYDFRPIFAGAAPVVGAADLALCHMETPYGGPQGPFTGYPLFKAPPQIAQALAETGYDGCSTASNHSLDDGFDGLSRTLDTLDAAGVKHAGTARTEAESGPAMHDVKGVRIAHLSFTYDTNGIPLPDGRPWAVNVTDAARIVEQARAARRAGAQLVVLSLHWGSEWQIAADERQIELGRLLTASNDNGVKDIDLVLGTHNHVPQPYELVNGTWVVYGMGDQMANFPAKPLGNMSSIARFTLTPGPDGPAGRWTVTGAEFMPQWSRPGPPFRIVNVNAALADPALDPATRAAYENVRRQVGEAVLSRGAAAQGLTEAADGR